MNTPRDAVDNELTWKDKADFLDLVGDVKEESEYLNFARQMVSVTPFEARLAVIWPALLVVAMSIGVAKVTGNILGYTKAKETG